MKPQPKVAAAGIGGSVSVIAIWIAGQFGLEVPAEVAAAFAAVVSFAAGYFRPA